MDIKNIDDRIRYLHNRKLQLIRENSKDKTDTTIIGDNFPSLIKYLEEKTKNQDNYLYGVDKNKKLYNFLGPKTHFRKDRILIYADVNTNIIDGSSIWLINVATLFAKRYKVEILLKANIQNSILLSKLEKNNNINIITPDHFQKHLDRFEDTHYLKDFSASELIYRLDMENGYHFIVCRGFYVSHYLASNPYIKDKLVTYLLVQHDDIRSDQRKNKIDLTVKNSKIIILQTELAKNYILNNFDIDISKIILLPPLIDDSIYPVDNDFRCIKQKSGCLYAGKFDVNWRTPDILKIFADTEYKITLVGNKFHDQKVSGKKLKEHFFDIVEKHNNIEYIGALPHDEIPNLVNKYDYGISVRTDEFLKSLEFSTKVLEFGYLSKPTIVNDSQINRIVLGDDYPLFANTNDEITNCIKKIEDDEIYNKAARMCFDAAQKHTMTYISSYLFDNIEICFNKKEKVKKFITIIDIDINKNIYFDKENTILFLNDMEIYDQKEIYERAFKWSDVIIYYSQDNSIKAVLNMAENYHKKIFIVNSGEKESVKFSHKSVFGSIAKEEYKKMSSDDFNKLVEKINNEIGLTIIIPSKDTQAYMLYRAIDSILHQKNIENYDYEIIIVDDGSECLVSELTCNRYDESHPIWVIRNENNQGLGFSRNIGLENSKGKHIYFMDADDFYNSEYISSVEKILEDVKYNIVVCAMKIMYEDTNKLTTNNHINIGIADMSEPDYDKKIKGAIRLVNSVVKGFRKKDMIKNRYFHDRGYHEDIFPWIKYYFENNPSVGVCKEAVYIRTIRYNSNQITQNKEITRIRLQHLILINLRILDMLKYLNKDGMLDKTIDYYNNRYLVNRNQLYKMDGSLK